MEGLEVEKEVTGDALSDQEKELIFEMRKKTAQESASKDLGSLLLGIAEEYPDFKDEIAAFVQKKVLKVKKTGAATVRSSVGWLVTDGVGETVFCPNTEQARLFMAQLCEKGCPAGTAASLSKHAESRGFSVVACSDPDVITKYPRSDGLKRVYEEKKRTAFAVATK